MKSAREGVMTLYAALRKGDIPTVQAILPDYEKLATQLRTQNELREASAQRLAEAVGLIEPPTLTALAAKLPHYADEFLTLRTRLRELTGQVEHFRSANANLLERLRSFFGDVLSDLTAHEVALRYGPTGTRLTVSTTTAIVASG